MRSALTGRPAWMGFAHYSLLRLGASSGPIRIEPQSVLKDTNSKHGVAKLSSPREPELIPVNGIHREGRETDGDVFSAFVFRSAVSDPLAAMGNHRLAGTNIDRAAKVLYS